MKSTLLILSTIIFCSCNNLLDADLAKRNTYIKLYNGIFGIEATGMELTQDGAIIIGTMRTDVDSVFYTLAFHVDKNGERISDLKYYTDFKGFTGKSIKSLPGGGFLIAGDRLSRNQNRTVIDNIDIYVSQLLPIGNDLQPGTPIYRVDQNATPGSIVIDYNANAVTMNSSGDIIVLGTYQNSNTDPVRPYLRAYSSNMDSILWTQDFESEARSYKNAKALHYNSGSLIWASAITVNQGGLNYAYTSIPKVQESSVFTNNSKVGENTEMIQPNDIQPANHSAFGYGVIGTRSNADGTLSNMYFLRVDVNGNIYGLQYFDAVESAKNTEVTEAISTVQDFGTALTSTSDGGFVLAGHFLTANQTSDILLIKIDAFGNQVWLKTLGGTGSETVTSIRETEDRGLLLLGTHVIGGIPSVFLIKTDKNGDFKN